jgi:hypothetical protein
MSNEIKTCILALLSISDKSHLMSLCPNCNHQTQAGSNFCNHCGTDLRSTKKNCPVCSHQNPAISVYCHACSYQFSLAPKAAATAWRPRFAMHPERPEQLPEQVKAQFFRFLRQRIFEEQDGRKYADYTNRFYDSRFKELFEVRAKQIVNDISRLHRVQAVEAGQAIDILCHRAFDGLADFFLVQYCPDINTWTLPSTILKYEKYQANRAVTWQMICDFLAFETEQERFYFDFITMPEQLLRNAIGSYIVAGKGAKLFFVCDLSLNGQCRDGLALTDQGIYWKLPFGKPKGFRFDQLYEVRKDKNWLVVNENHLMINTGFELKLLKLLRKLMPEHAMLKNSLHSHLVSK